MEEKKLINNKITITGKIDSDFEFSHRAFGEDFYTVYVLVRRKSGVNDRLPLMISEALIDVSQDYKGEYIIVSGQYRSYNLHDDDKNRLILNVFAQELNFIEEEIHPDKINNIFLEGYVCKPPVYRKTPLGREIADILIAVNRPYGRTDYIPCICWGRNARRASGLPVGAHVQLTGRVQSREYTKALEHGSETRTAYEVSVSSIEKLEQEWEAD